MRSGRYLCLFITLIFASHLKGQECVGSTGCCIQSDSCSISFSVGEVISTTIFSSNMVLTQGFQQPILKVIPLKSALKLNYQINAYPNPVHSILRLDIDHPDKEHFNLQLIDNQGRIVFLKDGFDEFFQIPMDRFIPSIYYLKIYYQKTLVRSFKVVKQ